MSRTTSPKQDTRQPSQAINPTESSITLDAPSHSSQRQFYVEYREALKEHLRGNSERFLAFQKDPRITPAPESLGMRKEAHSTSDSATIVNTERLNIATEAKVAVISLMASARSLATTLASLFT